MKNKSNRNNSKVLAGQNNAPFKIPKRTTPILCAALLLAGCVTDNNNNSSSANSVSSSSIPAVSSAANSSSSSPGAVEHATCPSTSGNAYQQTVQAIPGRVEAENYDMDGFSDSSDENEGGVYRSDAVDVKAIDTGYALGWMTSGEYLEYTIDVPTDGSYDVTIRSAATSNGRSLRISQCGSTLVEEFSVPRVSSWGDFKTWSAGQVQLTQGVQKIRVEVSGSDYMDLDWVHIGPYDGELDPEVTSCELPSSFEWEASPALISPPSGAYGIKDPSVVYYENEYHIFATINDDDWKSVYLTFTDWSNAGSAQYNHMHGTRGGNTVAPQVFYYRPHGLWYNFTQWPRGYNTTDDISDVNSWEPRRDFLTNGPPTEQGKPELDYWNICDDTHCHLFFSRDDGVLYKSKTTRANFPNFVGYEIVMEDHRGNGNSFLFEAANVYKLDGLDQYLLLVEAYRTPGYGPRYFRSWTATSLDGPWEPLADTEENPFAGEANVTWPAGNKWATGISHGEMVRSGYDEYLTVDPCNLEFVFQGDTGESLNGGYGGEPYKLGILRPKR